MCSVCDLEALGYVHYCVSDGITAAGEGRQSEGKGQAGEDTTSPGCLYGYADM